ncbi:MAG: zinc ribbon domain-containing protein [Ilumatobacteraceae bacterium]
MSNSNCPQCNAQLTEGQWMCPSCGTPVPSDDVERTVVRPVLPSPAPPMPGVITSVPSAGTWDGPGTPSFAPPATWSPIQSTPADLGDNPMQRSSTAIPTVPIVAPAASAAQKWLPKVAVVLALLSVGFVAWKVIGSGDDEAASSGSTIAGEVIAGSTVPGDTSVDGSSTTVAIENTVPTTVPPTTAPATTVPPVTEPPVTVPARPPWPAPAIPDPPIFSGFGLAYAISDPLVSGMPSDEPTPYLAFAQQVFDEMALDDWATALSHFYFRADGLAAGPYTFDKQNQWSVADRLSVLLVDAAPSPDGFGYDLRVAVVANFPGSTSLLCGRLHSDPNTYAEVIQLGTFSLLADGDPPYMPETLLNDPARIADIQARCV